jgi:hypothetical protein
MAARDVEAVCVSYDFDILNCTILRGYSKGGTVGYGQRDDEGDVKLVGDLS